MTVPLTPLTPAEQAAAEFLRQIHNARSGPTPYPPEITPDIRAEARAVVSVIRRANGSSSSAPRLVTQTGLAHHFGVHHTTVIAWRRYYPEDHPRLPTPAPAAFVLGKFSSEIPLWAPEQIADWELWRKTRLSLSRPTSEETQQ